ncbi:MAG: hypothetical protein ACTSVR_12135, partial [Candidatus Thorarchaeota archaeon]
LEKKFGFKEGSQAIGIVDQVRDYLMDFAEIAQQGLDVEKANYVHELTRGKARMGEEEAWRFVNEKLQFNEEDLFFPRRSLGMLNKAVRLRNEMNLQEDPIQFLLKNKSIKDDNGLFGHKSTSHVLRRQYEATSNRNSMDLMSVLQGYSNELISYWHDNKLNLMLNRHMDNMNKVWKEVKDVEGYEWFKGYTDGLDDYLKNFAEQSKGRYTGGKLAEISKIITAWKVGLTMGFLNPSTPLLNMAEGQALILTRAGRHYLFDSSKENHYHKISNIVEKEWTRVAGEEHLQQESAPASLGLIDEHDPMGHYKRTEKDTSLLFLQRTRRAVTNVAKKSIVLQRKAENINRQKAFKAGSLMEYEFILQYEHLFRDKNNYKDAQSILELKSYGITQADFDNKASRAKAWDKFVKKRIVKSGYEMVYQTQWNYNMVARHFFEGHPIGKLAMMFQHYPLSWVASLRRTYDILNSVRRAGSAEGAGTRRGVQAMFERDTKSNALGMWMNPEMLFALTSGAIAMTMGAMRMGTGIVLGQFWQHPAIDTVEDMIKYTQNNFNGEDEKNKALFWGQGVANQFMGPFYSDLSDAVSLAALKMGIEDGDMPMWTSDVLRGTLGFRPNEVLLTRFGSRQYNNAWDVMYETFLMGGMSVAPKATRIAKSIPGISEKFFGKEADLKDLSHAIFRAIGVRDQKGVDKWIHGQLEKDKK